MQVLSWTTCVTVIWTCPYFKKLSIFKTVRWAVGFRPSDPDLKDNLFLSLEHVKLKFNFDSHVRLQSDF